MINVIKDASPEEIKLSSRHVLFVEGIANNSFDAKIFSNFLDIRIKPLGHSYSVKSAAQALYPSPSKLLFPN